jgi:hypothetical protein
MFKLSSGELVYGTVDDKKSDKKMLVLNDPLIWEDYESEDGRTGSALVKYMVGAGEEQIPIAKLPSLSMSTMSDHFANFYDVAVEVQRLLMRHTKRSSCL